MERIRRENEEDEMELVYELEGNDREERRYEEEEAHEYEQE